MDVEAAAEGARPLVGRGDARALDPERPRRPGRRRRACSATTGSWSASPAASARRSSRPATPTTTDWSSIRLGERRGPATPRIEALAEVWRGAGFTVQTFDDVERLVWEKLVCNVAFSGTCTVLGRTIGEVLDDPDAWSVASGCAGEAYRGRTRVRCRARLRRPRRVRSRVREEDPGRAPVDAARFDCRPTPRDRLHQRRDSAGGPRGRRRCSAQRDGHRPRQGARAAVDSAGAGDRQRSPRPPRRDRRQPRHPAAGPPRATTRSRSRTRRSPREWARSWRSGPSTSAANRSRSRSRQGRQVVQDDCATASDDPAFHRMRETYGGLAAQIVTPVLPDGEVAAIVSLHQLGSPRHWTERRDRGVPRGRRPRGGADLMHNRWHPDIEPVAEVAPGEEIRLEAEDGLDGQLTRESTHADAARARPRARPSADGAGATSRAPSRATCSRSSSSRTSRPTSASPRVIPGFGFLADVFTEPYLVKWEIADGIARSAELPGVAVPEDMFAGVVGVAPSHGRLEAVLRARGAAARAGPAGRRLHARSAPFRPTLQAACARSRPARRAGTWTSASSSPAAGCGCPWTSPARCFSVGDLHFAQGDGEVCGTAIEVAGAVTVRFALHDGAGAGASRATRRRPGPQPAILRDDGDPRRDRDGPERGRARRRCSR